jgi:hypothetical protein
MQGENIKKEGLAEDLATSLRFKSYRRRHRLLTLLFVERIENWVIEKGGS